MFSSRRLFGGFSLMLAFAIGLSRAQGGDAGTSGATFLRLGGGPRAAAMGEAQTAAVEDAYAAYWNPAALALLPRREVAMTHQKSIQDIREQTLNLASRWGRRAGVAAYGTQVSVKPFSAFDANGAPVGDVKSSESAYGLAAGYRWTRRVRVGLGAKLIRSALGPASASSRAFDAGTLVDLPFLSRYRPTFGFAARNVGSSLRYDNEAARLPTSYHAGLAARLPLQNQLLTFAVDYNTSATYRSFLSLGQEFWVNKILALRAGYRFGREEGGLGAGLAIRARSVEISYSLVPQGFMGDAHRLGLSYQFGRLAPPLVKRPVAVRDLPAAVPVAPPAPPAKPVLDVTISTEALPVPTPVFLPPVPPAADVHEKAAPAPKKAPSPLYKSKERLLPGSATELILKGKAYMRDGRYHEATVAFGQAVRAEPNNKEALDLMRKALNEMDRQKRQKKGIYE